MNKVLQLLNEGRQKYDNASMYQIYMDGILDTLNVVNDLLGSKEDEKAGEDKEPTSFYFETISKRYIKTTDADLLNAAKEMVQKIISERYVTVNEWFELLGLPHLENGDKLGWTVDTMFGIDTFEDGIHYDNQPVALVRFPLGKIDDQPDINNE